MSTTYAGTDTFPTNVTLPADGDPRTASSVNTPMQGLADRTTWLKRITDLSEPIPYLNWYTSTLAVSSHVHAFYNTFQTAWWIVGSTERGDYSFDMGRTWITDVLAAAGAGENCMFGDADTTGSAVISTDSRYVFNSSVGATPLAAPTVTKVDVFGAALTAVASTVTYDPINSLWVWIANRSAASVLTYTSTNRTAWTSRTPPFAGNVSGPMRAVCRKDTGRTVAVIGLASSFSVSFSNDGGVTWSAEVVKASTIATPTELGLAYNPTTGRWLITIGEVVGTPTGEVWESTDNGATWTKIKTFTGTCVMSPAPQGKTWVSTATTTGPENHIVYSLDNGVTWKKAGVYAANIGRGAYFASGGVLALFAGDRKFADRVGDPGLAAVT